MFSVTLINASLYKPPQLLQP